MGKILQTGNIFRIAEIQATYETLPKGVYNLNVSPGGFYLTKTSDFKLPEKVYGDLSPVDRWLKTYEEKTRNVGILLSGLKGGGKTITAKLLAIKANKPVIVIGQSFHGPEFTDFITDPALGDCVIFIDEFEKIYRANNDEDGNDSLLSLLDGPYETHHLFIFTVNQTNINSNLINRPSRILYAKRYEGLNEEDIIEIANDKLKDKKYMEDLIRTSHKIFQLSFDILISIIDEVNRFDEPASKCIEYMNLTPKKITFNASQWYINEEGKVDHDYGAWDNAINFEDEGLTLNVEYHYHIIRSDGSVRYDYENIEIPMDNAKKVDSKTYEVFDKYLCALYTVTENGSEYYGYGSRSKYRPKNVQYEKLTVWVDGDGNYVKHIPTAITLETVKNVIGTKYFKNNSKKSFGELECKVAEPSDPCWNEESDLDCGDCECGCAG